MEKTFAAIDNLNVLAALSRKTESKVHYSITVDGNKVKTLIDTGSTLTHVNKEYAKKYKLEKHLEANEISMAVNGNRSQSSHYCIVSIKLQGRIYKQVKLIVLDNLFVDVILGQEFLEKHQHVQINFEGSEPSLKLGALSCIKSDVTPKLFENVDPGCKSIATKSRRQSPANERFIDETIRRDLDEGVIEPSSSPWRAQVLVTAEENHRKRLCLDYSETINKFTQLDGYPLPNMHDMVSKIAQFNYFSTLYFKSAYHQVEIPSEDSLYSFRSQWKAVSKQMNCFWSHQCRTMLPANSRQYY